jgi:hypothetical protein
MLTYLGSSISKMLHYLRISYLFCIYVCLFISMHLMKTFSYKITIHKCVVKIIEICVLSVKPEAICDY